MCSGAQNRFESNPLNKFWLKNVKTQKNEICPNSGFRKCFCYFPLFLLDETDGGDLGHRGFLMKPALLKGMVRPYKYRTRPINVSITEAASSAPQGNRQAI